MQVIDIDAAHQALARESGTRVGLESSDYNTGYKNAIAKCMHIIYALRCDDRITELEAGSSLSEKLRLINLIRSRQEKFRKMGAAVANPHQYDKGYDCGAINELEWVLSIITDISEDVVPPEVWDAYCTIRQKYPGVARQLLRAYDMNEDGSITMAGRNEGDPPSMWE